MSLHAPVAALTGPGTAEILNPNTGAVLDPALGLPVEEIHWEPLVGDFATYCAALTEALALPRTRVCHFTARLAPAVFDTATEVHIVDALLDKVRAELELAGFVGFRSLNRGDDAVTFKVVLIDAYRHSDQ